MNEPSPAKQAAESIARSRDEDAAHELDLMFIQGAIDAATAKLSEELELAWGIIANVHGGDWDKESKEWQDAAIRWRDRYFASLPKVSQAASEQPNAHQQPSTPYKHEYADHLPNKDLSDI